MGLPTEIDWTKIKVPQASGQYATYAVGFILAGAALVVLVNISKSIGNKASKPVMEQVGKLTPPGL